MASGPLRVIPVVFWSCCRGYCFCYIHIILFSHNLIINQDNFTERPEFMYLNWRGKAYMYLRSRRMSLNYSVLLACAELENRLFLCFSSIESICFTWMNLREMFFLEVKEMHYIYAPPQLLFLRAIVYLLEMIQRCNTD